MKERDVERHLVLRIRQRGGMCIKLMPTIAGIPDRLVVLPGRPMLFVELKGPGGKLSPIQVEIHKRLATIGQPVTVLWSKEEVDEWLTSL